MLPFSQKNKAFTLVELMVSTAIIGLIMVILVGMTNQMSKTWRDTAEKVEKFQLARDGFESMTRRLSQATLNTNWDYLGTDSSDPAGSTVFHLRNKTVGTSQFNSFVPLAYGRTADLRIISGPMWAANSLSGSGLDTNYERPTHGIFFQAPFGVADLANSNFSSLDNGRNQLNNALNTWGYYVEAGMDLTVPTFLSSATLHNSSGRAIVKPRWRCRLMEFRQPTEAMSLYDPTSATPNTDWYDIPLKNATAIAGDPTVRVLAENIVALVLVPKLSKNDEDNLKAQNMAWQLCPYYVYDSTKTLNPGSSGPPGTTAAINPKNQLPPIIQVTMVAVDERSAKALDERYGCGVNPTPASIGSYYGGLDKAGLNCTPAVNVHTLFTNQAHLLEGAVGNAGKVAASDLNSLEQIFIHERLTYRVFTSNVTVVGAKWSRVQTQ